MLPEIKILDRTVAFMADLIPSAGHLPVAFLMAYDTRPLITLEEKASYLKKAVENNYLLFFEHDPVSECCSLVQTDKGVRVQETFTLKSFTG
jgi:hypothetical protein